MEEEISSVSIIGGGYVGFPLGMKFIENGLDVTIVDIDEQKLETFNSGVVPFKEIGTEEVLEEALEDDQLTLSTDLFSVTDTDAVVITIGTPIDEHHNPQMEQLMNLIEDLENHLNKEQLVILRSTIYPGTTEIVRHHLEESGFIDGEDIYLSVAPERIVQHESMQELEQIPQLVGAFTEESYEQTKILFETFLDEPILHMKPKEAELGKLFTNMWRYLTFAAANEFYLLSEEFNEKGDVNIHRILDYASHEYDRFDVPTPGANVGGPCLTKDGWFLVNNTPYNELVSASYQINEGIPSQIIDRLETYNRYPRKIAVLGMTFKRGSDDVRNSVAFKYKQLFELKGHPDVEYIEPHLDEFGDLSDIDGADWVILVTPHEEFEDIERVHSIVDNPDCIYCDIWGMWNKVKYKSDNAFFTGILVESLNEEGDTDDVGLEKGGVKYLNSL